MMPEARVVHRGAGRCRLRIADKRGDPGFFARLGEELEAELPGSRVSVNATTGSILIRGVRPSLEDLRRFGHERGWFELADTAQAGPGTDALLHLPLDVSGPDARRMLTVTFVGLAAVQALRGQILVPATSFLWYALAVSAVSLPRT